MTETTENQAQNAPEDNVQQTVPIGLPVQESEPIPIQVENLINPVPPVNPAPVPQTEVPKEEPVQQAAKAPTPASPAAIVTSISTGDLNLQENHFEQDLENQMELISERLQKMADRIVVLQKNAQLVSQKLDVIECV
ncbi:hypothetical protein TVAG_444010 [Trichomonas vaginalis G3]|uniref:Uncharacterized protein n=1 Tax=Trichomonas vaginalis (strain ATCC PRA-98 / G3) TaxID=412133 RepID=A2E2E3_TRIV3|nr:hypothetical protein TVAGG3_0305370 [Trichomonas vaginalis G3]EAY13118.1 hypothetical protein TVAG_444010 [Trichomonas vaginalis G3]KAI5528219.1 hypothetical protein TVAGG3_0305370 [Trichomonas vaginalis G3]|eukprot:XP_001325341.1 hypothetical protein [Trichomonas vaginalis G3]